MISSHSCRQIILRILYARTQDMCNMIIMVSWPIRGTCVIYTVGILYGVYYIYYYYIHHVRWLLQWVVNAIYIYILYVFAVPTYYIYIYIWLPIYIYVLYTGATIIYIIYFMYAHLRLVRPTEKAGSRIFESPLLYIYLRI